MSSYLPKRTWSRVWTSSWIDLAKRSKVGFGECVRICTNRVSIKANHEWISQKYGEFGNGGSKNFKNRASANKNKFVCAHCREVGHLKQRCYEIMGYPNWWDFSKKPCKNILGNTLIASKEEEENVTPFVYGNVSALSIVFE